MAQLWTQSITELRPALQSGDITAETLTAQILERAQSIGPTLNAFTAITPDAAMQTARALDHAGPCAEAPLWGIPMAHKDNFASALRQPGCGVAAVHPAADLSPSPILQALEAAGTIEIGTVSMAEFALGTTGTNAHFGDCRNPWNPDYCTGGSSSGSAAAVAAGLVFASIGTDTGASVRMPAALCGVVGMMPTRGSLTNEGCFPLSWSLDQPGVLTRSLRDNALVLDSAEGRGRVTPVDPERRLTIGVPQSYYTDYLAPEVASAYQDAIRTLERAGHKLVPVAVVEGEEMRSLHRVLMRSEASALHGKLMRDYPEHYDLPVRKFIVSGEAVAAVDYIDALRARGPMLRRALDTTYSQCDLILTPAAPTLALRYADIRDAGNRDNWLRITRLAHCTQPATYLGLPAASVPFTISDSGLPIGLQLIAPPGGEARIYSAGLALEAHWQGLNLWPQAA